MMTEKKLLKIEALANAATPGPWKYTKKRKMYQASIGFYRLTDPFISRENAEFIAAAREAVPALIAEVQRLRAYNAKLATLLEKVNDLFTVEKLP